jgi:hypothetical protein
MARRFGSAMTSNTDSMVCIYSNGYIRLKGYIELFLRWSGLGKLEGTPNSQRLGSAFAVGAGEYDDIVVGIAEPNLAVLGRRVEVRFQDDLGVQGAGTLDDGVKIVYLEPEQDTVSGGRRVAVDEVGMVFRVPGVELEKQLARARDALVEVAMRVVWERVRCEKFPVPATTGADIAHGYEGLSGDGRFVGGHYLYRSCNSLSFNSRRLS